MALFTFEEFVDFAVRAIFNFIAEFFGTAILMTVGCLGIFDLGRPLQPTGEALSFSISVIVGMEIALPTSGGHLNPIITVASMFFRKLSIPMGIVYITAQFCGGVLGFGLVKCLIPKKYFPAGFCCTVPHPDLHLAQAVFIEYVTSTILVLMVCAQWNPRNTRIETTTIKIGLTLFCLVYASIPFTGGSLNPARSFGPAVWNNTWKNHWIYWISPFAASFIWAPIYYKLFVELAP